MKSQLRDAYMNFKDLQLRCVVDMTPDDTDEKQEGNLDVFYFQPDTFLLSDPEKQKEYRETLLQKIATVPKPPQITCLGDELHKTMCQTIADRATPTLTKNQLSAFFQRRQYSLQHMKYRLLCRWAHHNLTSESMENISTDATFIYGKLEFNLKQATQRYDRLKQHDYYDQVQRPSTKTEEGGHAMYVERTDMLSQSLIREDDIEVYIRSVCHRNKINKVVNKFMSRLKWLPMLKKFEIFETAIQKQFELKTQNIKRQNDIVERVKARAKKEAQSPEQLAELNKVLEDYYCVKYEKMFMTQNDRTLHSWKANHDTPSDLISDVYLLKLRIQDESIKFNIDGDIDLDNGYSFCYQVTVFFPSYFQKQVLRSQFSIYDTEEDPEQAKKRALSNITKIDTNIFRDLSTTKAAVPSDEAIDAEFKGVDIKVIRLRTSAFWICYVTLIPTEPDWHKKQQAVLNCDNPIDNLLKSGMNFLDVCDLASVNRVLEDTAHLHQKNVRKLVQRNPNNIMTTRVVPTTDGDKSVTMDKLQMMNSGDHCGNLQAHLLPTVQDQYHAEESKNQPSRLNTMAAHLLTAYNILRYMTSRDCKTRIMYTLNYFRAVQKRLALDLREFATRDRIEAHLSNPFIQSRQANQAVINQANFSTKAYEEIQIRQKQVKNKDSFRVVRNMMVFEEKIIQELKDMASLRNYKSNGLFSNKVLETCPSYPKYHAMHGEPLSHLPLDEEISRGNQFRSISENSINLMGRIEKIEIDESAKEVYIKDDFGLYIMYDCVLQDMTCLEKELVRIGSYFLHRAEVLQDPSISQPLPAKDRLDLLKDLLEKESDFQFQKVKLVQVYMECYEHVTDPLESQKLMQVITDIMARRPRLNLQANYFVDAYDAEIQCLEKQFQLIKCLVDSQISLEKAENQRLQDSLQLSYTLCNQYTKDTWRYQDAQALLNLISDAFPDKGSRSLSPNYIPPAHPKSPTPTGQSESQAKTPLQESQENLLTEDNYGDFEEQDFKALLGLPQITMESIYLSYKQNDLNIIKLMAEHSHFITIHEGYPEFLTKLTHRSIIDKNRTFKVSPWSQETGSLDFYETLDFASKVYSIMQAVQNELYDGLQMWDTTLLTQIDIIVAELALKEFQHGIKISEGQDTQYEGRCLVEDEQIMGSSDKMIFYAKEMIADLTMKPKHLQDSFIIAKMDLETIKYFEFPKIPLHLNKYTLRKGTDLVGKDYLIETEKHAIIGIGKGKANVTNFAADLQNLFNMDTHLQASNINIPSMLTLYCNMMELHRIRSEIILTTSECSILSQIYLQQCQFVNFKKAQLVADEPISFDPLEIHGMSQFVNFTDHGPSHLETIDLAIREFDKSLLSNFNFRNPDTFKLNILTSGLEEVRAVLHYQLMQKQLLIVATRINASLISSYQRAFSELQLIASSRIAVPNSTVNYSMILNKNMETCNLNYLKSERTKIQQNLASFCAPLFYNVMPKKSASRASISKELSNYQTQAVNEMPQSDYCIRRAIRSFKVKLLTKFVQQTLTEVYLDAQKVQALQSCQELRKFDRYFMFQPQKIGLGKEPKEQVFRYESSHFRENLFTNYMPENLIKQKDPNELHQTKKPAEIKVVDDNYKILDFQGIPSSQRLMTLESASNEELKKFRKLLPGIDTVRPSANDPEMQLKQLLPTFTPIGSFEDGNEYKEAVHYSRSKYAQFAKYYSCIERLLTLDWFILKLQLRPDEAVYIDNAISSGVPFWQPDEFDSRVLQEVNPSHGKCSNPMSQQFFYDQIVNLRKKQNIAMVVKSLGLTLTSLIQMYQKTKPDQREEFLNTYTEFRYQQIIGSLHKLVQRYYQQHNMKAVGTIRAAIVETTQVDHIRMTRLKPNNYTVTNSVIGPSYRVLESSNLIYGSLQHEDILNFKRCVQPIINEKALEPAQVTLFQSMYQHDKFRQEFSTQFAGALKVPQFRTLDAALLNLAEEERVYCCTFIIQQKYQANDFIETVFQDTSLANQTKEEAYSLSQVIQAQKFLNEQTQALLLRNALICWYENSSWPQSPQQYEQFESNFRQNFFWKQLEQYDLLVISKKGQMGKIPTQAELAALRLQIDELVSDMTLATDAHFQHRDLLVQTLRTEFAALKKKVALDNYFTIKSELHVFKNEIEKFLIAASIKVLESESTALAKCFTMQVPSIQYHIHPFQQFAATMFDQVDPNLHLDVTNKVGAIQAMLTKLKNRSTEVETLTSGPALVVTIKDLNDILVEFCKESISYMEPTFKSRQETSWMREQHLMQLLYHKDTQLVSLNHRIHNIGVNLEKIIDARLFEKGNHLIYQLDHSNRVLALVKGQMHGLEQHLVAKIQSEQVEKFKRMANLVELKTKKFEDYKQTIWNTINADFAEDQERIKEQLKFKAEQAKNTDNGQKPLLMYSTGVVPAGFEHYPSCTCYKPDPRFPRPTFELAEAEMLSEAEARRELSKLCKLVRTQRILYRFKEMCLMQKYQDKINRLTKNQNENCTLWDQLASAEKRERTLKLELLHTQNLLSGAEKQIASLKDHVNKIEQERSRLITFKTSKMELLKELEAKVKHYDLSGNIDIEKLVAALKQKDEQLKEVSGIKQIFDQRIEQEQQRHVKDVKSLRQKLANEQWHTKQIVDKMEQMKVELKMLENNDTSATAVWKRKCFDIFEICTALKDENLELKAKCRDIVQKGILLAENILPQSELPQVVIHQRRRSVFERNKKSVVTADTDRHSKNRSLMEQAKPCVHRTQVMTPQIKIKDTSILGVLNDRTMIRTQNARRASQPPITRISVREPVKPVHNLAADMTQKQSIAESERTDN